MSSCTLCYCALVKHRRPYGDSHMETCERFRDRMQMPSWGTCSGAAVAATFCAARCMKRIWPSLLFARRLLPLPPALAVGAEAGDGEPSPLTLFMMAYSTTSKLLLTC